MKITEYTPTPEYLYHDHLKRRKDAIKQACIFIEQADAKTGRLLREKTLSRKDRNRLWWGIQCDRELSIKAIQLADQHARAAALILSTNPRMEVEITLV